MLRPALPAIAERRSAGRIEVLLDTALRDIIGERFHAGIRISEKLGQDVISLRLRPDLRMVVVATKAYLSDYGAPELREALSTRRCIGYRPSAREFGRQGRELAVDVGGSLIVNEPDLALDAALDGLGLAYVMKQRARPYLDEGRLVSALDD